MDYNRIRPKSQTRPSADTRNPSIARTYCYNTPMNHKERFLATINRRAVDRPACWLGLPCPDAFHNLLEYFNVSSLARLKEILGDDLYAVEIPYRSPNANSITAALDLAGKDKSATLTAPGFFADIHDPACIEDFNWPDPNGHIDAAECKKIVHEVPDEYAAIGVLWSSNFQDACAACGMESAFIKMADEPRMFQAIIDRVTQFYLQANDIFYKATAHRLDAVLMGNDFGSQDRLMLSPNMLRKYVWPYAKKLIRQAKDYRLPVIYHSCGSIYEIIGDLIELGVDVIHPFEPTPKNMMPEKLKKDFGDKVSFCGGIDAQHLLPDGTPSQIRQKVKQLKKLFPTGLVISPSREAISPDIPPQNIQALFEAISPSG